MFTEKPHRKWQNLLYKKCPNCDGDLVDNGHYFTCKNPHPLEAHRSCFFIKKETAAAYLVNPNHPAHFCLTADEKEQITKVVNTMSSEV
jgi:hypothetical protein